MISSRAPCQVPGLPAPQSSFCPLPQSREEMWRSQRVLLSAAYGLGVLTLVGLGTVPCFLLPEIRLPLASVSFVQFFLPLLASSSLCFLSLSPLFPQERLPHLSLTFQGSSLQVTQGPHSLYSQTEPSLSFETYPEISLLKMGIHCRGRWDVLCILIPTSLYPFTGPPGPPPPAGGGGGRLA